MWGFEWLWPCPQLAGMSQTSIPNGNILRSMYLGVFILTPGVLDKDEIKGTLVLKTTKLTDHVR